MGTADSYYYIRFSALTGAMGAFKLLPERFYVLLWSLPLVLAATEVPQTLGYRASIYWRRPLLWVCGGPAGTAMIARTEHAPRTGPLRAEGDCWATCKLP